MLCLLLWGLPSTEDPLGTLPIMTVTHLSPWEALQAGQNGWFHLCPLLSYLCDSPHTTSSTWNVLPSPLCPIHPSIWQIKCHLFHEVLLNSPKGNESLPSLLSGSNLLLSNLFFIDLSYAFYFFFFTIQTINSLLFYAYYVPSIIISDVGMPKKYNIWTLLFSLIIQACLWRQFMQKQKSINKEAKGGDHPQFPLPETTAVKIFPYFSPVVCPYIVSLLCLDPAYFHSLFVWLP